MEYKELSKLYHMDNSSNREGHSLEELERRRGAASTFDIGIETKTGPLFVAMPAELSVLMERILRAERRMSSLMRSFPSIVRARIVRGLVLDEVMSTNAVEQIHSTRKQVEEALESGEKGDLSFKRFKELALLYLGLDGDEIAMPKTPSDIRSIYDAVTEGEIPANELPDGKVFRAEGSDVVAGGVRVVHSGVESEQKIVENMEAMLALLKRDDIPEIISAVASHYIFEYTHPFYDGNGRTGRYLLALFLSDVLSVPTVLSLSRAIAENKTMYYEAFASAEKPLNRGELTFFVLRMMELIRIAQSETMDRLEECSRAYDAITEGCGVLFEEEEFLPYEKEILYALAQYSVFGAFGAMSIEDVAGHIGLGKQSTRKYLAGLERKELVRKCSSRPAKFELTSVAKKRIGVEEGNSGKE